jgi:hypothetical protein
MSLSTDIQSEAVPARVLNTFITSRASPLQNEHFSAGDKPVESVEER